TLGDAQVAQLLTHLWSTDGTSAHRGNDGHAERSFATPSRPLAHDVAALLLRLGIVAAVRSSGGAQGRTLYHVDLTELDPQRAFADAAAGFVRRGRPLRVVGDPQHEVIGAAPHAMLQMRSGGSFGAPAVRRAAEEARSAAAELYWDQVVGLSA